MKKFLPLLIISLVIAFFFKDFVLGGKIPLPADTIVGLYHPWRDYYAANYPNGIPFKNSLITDPVRQQYPWKLLAIEQIKQGKLPVWNPYSFSGAPLLANFQSGVFYPLNIIFFLLPFSQGWGVYILMQFLLGGIFMYLYLNNLKISKTSSLFGSLVFTFSGVFIAWGWWGNIIHTLLWLPFLLLSIDKVVFCITSLNRSKIKYQISKIEIKNQKLAIDNEQSTINPQSTVNNAKCVMRNALIKYLAIFIFSLCSSFFAGHLQVFFYVFMVTIFYLISKIIFLKNKIITMLVFGLCFLIFGLITSVQWLPTLHFISQSARGLDQTVWQKPGWFLPWENLLQFLVPDFFGNPSTGNYWGIWNYGEFIGYIGVLPFILAAYVLFFRRDKKVFFFGSLFFLTLLFALPTPFAKLPYLLKIPFISTSQPTRLLIITDFSLVVLAALGFDYFQKNKVIKDIIKIITFLFISYGVLWLFVIIGNRWLTGNDWTNNLLIAKRNLILPTVIFSISTILLILTTKFNNIKINLLRVTCLPLEALAKWGALFLLILFDLFRFGWKFLPFVKEDYIYPKTKIITFLQNKQQEGRFRIMATDERIFPPNFSIVYHIESIDGYDPLFLRNYADLINKMENRDPRSSFNRIITPKNFASSTADLINVRYVLSLTDLESPKLKKVFQEGETRVYENLKYIKIPYFQNIYEY